MSSEKIARTERVNSLVRGLEVLKAFGRSNEPMTISEVASVTDIAPAAARRMLLTLADQGYVEQHGKRFSIGPKVLDLGYSYLSSMPLWKILQPVLERISQQFSVSAAAAVLEGRDIVFTVRANVWQRSSVLVSTGTRQPVHVTAMGRVLMANLKPEELSDILLGCEYKKYTAHSVRGEEELLKRIDEARDQSYAIVDQEYFYGLRAVAVPLRNRAGTVLAAMNASCGSHDFSLEELHSLVLPKLQEEANVVQSHIGA